jgi:hypothetical protein
MTSVIEMRPLPLSLDIPDIQRNAGVSIMVRGPAARAGTAWRFFVLTIIKAGGTCVAAVALTLAISPVAGAAATAPTHSSVAAAADHHQPRGQHGHRLAEGGGGWSHEEEHWDGGWDGDHGSGADWGTDFSSGEDHMSDWGHYRDNPGGGWHH